MSKKKREAYDEREARVDRTLDALISLREERDQLRVKYAEERQAKQALEAEARQLKKLVAEYEQARRFKDFDLNCYELHNLVTWQADVSFRRNVNGKKSVTIRGRGRRSVKAPELKQALDLAEQTYGSFRTRAAKA